VVPKPLGHGGTVGQHLAGLGADAEDDAGGAARSAPTSCR
jgi:hypothetical protein